MDRGEYLSLSYINPGPARQTKIGAIMIGLRNIAFLLGILGAVIAAPAPAPASGFFDPDPIEFSFSEFLAHADAKDVREVTLRGPLVLGLTADGRAFRAYMPQGADVVGRLLADGVTVKAEPDNGAAVMRFIISLVPAILLMIGIVFFGTGPQSRGVSADFRRSRMKDPNPSMQRVTFAEVAGVDEARQELEEIVEFLRDPRRFEELGGKIPTGVLLSGPPGTGKTLLARAIAGEAGVPFFSVSGSDFVEMFAGVGASRVRDTFARARAEAPSILFVDEIDAIGRRRGAGRGPQNDEREQTLNQLLVEMDGVEGSKGVILVAATNRPDSLDPALLRPGRFDRQVVMPVPDAAGRERILAVHLGRVQRDDAIDLGALARGTPGMSGAELANLVNEAALLAARRGLDQVGMAELDAAKDKVMMGTERRSLALTHEERRRTAYHEAGHALVATALPETGRLHKVTITPRGRALGLTLLVPEGDRHGYSKAEMTARIAMMFGGRVAEELIYGKNGITTGAVNDLQQATALARRMVTEFGFSERLGRLSFADAALQPSEATAELIDAEIRRIVEAGEAAARALLTARLDALHRAGAALLEHETLSADAFCRFAQVA